MYVDENPAGGGGGTSTKSALAQFAEELEAAGRRIAGAGAKAIEQNQATTADRALGIARLAAFVPGASTFLLFVSSDPIAEKVARLAGARRLLLQTFFRLQREWFFSGKNDQLALEDANQAKAMEKLLGDLAEIGGRALGAENDLAKIPEHIAQNAVDAFFGGLWSDVSALLDRITSIINKIKDVVAHALSFADLVLKYWWLALVVVLLLLWLGRKKLSS